MNYGMMLKTDMRIQADKALIEYLCKTTGRSASALATSAGMAPTTLNRFLSQKIKVKSTLKDTTLQKIAARWGLNELDILAYRQHIQDALRTGKPIPPFRKISFDATPTSGSGLREQTPAPPLPVPERDPLMDQIMGVTYEAWFHSPQRDAVAFDRLPDLVRLLYGRIRQEKKKITPRDLRSRAQDILTFAALNKTDK
jgi:hypothetical protein